MTALLLLAVLAVDPPKVPVDKDGYPDYEAALNDRLGKGITPDRNANVLLWKALGPRPDGNQRQLPEYFKRLGIDEPPEKGDYFLSLTAFDRDRLNLDADRRDAFYDQQTQASRRPWTAKEFPRLAEWLAANEKPLAVVAEAVKRPDYFNPLVCSRTGGVRDPLIGALLPSVSACRSLGDALAARAMFRLGEGQSDAAWDDILTCHRLGRHISRGGTLLEYLVGTSLDRMASNAALAYIDAADLTAARLRERLKELQALPRIAPLAEKIDITERYVLLDTLQVVTRGSLEMLTEGAGDLKLTAEQRKALAALDWSPVMQSANRLFDRMTAAAQLPTRAERQRAMGGVEADMKVMRRNATDSGATLRLLGQDREKEVVKRIGDIVISLYLPAVGKCFDHADRAEQVQRNLHVAFALAVYRKENGQYPQTLDVLALRYLASVPDDIFAARRLVYRREGAGYLLYSIGQNEKDDGGRTTDDPAGGDNTVRMPLPKK